MGDKGPEAAAAFARARDHAGRALERALRVGEAAASAEQRSRQGPAYLSETMARLAATLRSSQQRQLAVARLNAAYVSRLRKSMEQPGDCRAAAFLAAVAGVSRGSRIVFTVSGHEQPDALVAASDAVARSACDLERGYGEGPATDAVARRALVEADGDLAAVWPLYGPAVGRLGIHAVSAAPLCAAGRCLGSVSVLDPHPGGRGRGLRADQLADALVDTLLAGDIPADRDGLPRLPLFGGDQALIHQAAGMVAAESAVDVPDALALIRARAFADSQPAVTIAAQIVSRQLRLTLPG